MTLPNTFFGELAAKGPFVIFQNQLYQLCDSPDSREQIAFGEARFALASSSDLFELEGLYREYHHGEIFTFKKAFVCEPKAAPENC